MTIERAREILQLSDQYSDEYLQKLIDQMEVLAQIIIEQGPNLPLYINSLKQYDEDADNNHKE